MKARRRDGARGVLKRPVAAKVGRAGHVCGGGDIGAGLCSEGLDERITIGSAGNVATVKQDVAIGRQRSANRCQNIGVIGKISIGQDVGAQEQRRLAAVRNDLNGAYVRAASQVRRDLIKSARAIVDQDNLGLGIDRRKKLADVVDVLIDEHDRRISVRRRCRDRQCYRGSQQVGAGAVLDGR